MINKYSFSVKQQQIAAKKSYSIDTGLSASVGFSFSENKGRLIENLVYLHLRRKLKDIYYYKTTQGFEIDFYLSKLDQLVQVCQHFELEETKNREVRALLSAAKEIKGIKKLTILTEADESSFKKDGHKINVVPLYKWLLNKSN